MGTSEPETEMMTASEEQGEKKTESEIREEHQKGQKEPPDDRKEIPEGMIPVMLVVGGHSRVGRSAVARQFADYLKCPLLDQDDITVALEQSLSLVSSSAESTATVVHLFDDLPFQSLCQIASTQLGLQIRIILNTPLSRRAQFERLKQLAVDRGARMIIVDCRSFQDDNEDEDEDDDDDEDEYYDVGSIPKFTVDPKRPLETKELAAVLRRDQGNPSSQTLSAKVGFRELGNYRKIGEEAQSHLHELAYSEELPAVGTGKGLNCQKCGLLISSGPIYGCVECDAFNLHSSCAQTPKNTLKQLRDGCPAYLKSNAPQYNFPRTSRCQFCERSNKGFSADCFDCLLQTHLLCDYLPTILSECSHGHPLNFLITPLSYNYEYRCSACHTFGMSISYKCYKCNYDLHVDCALNEYLRRWNQEKLRVAVLVSKAASQYIQGVSAGAESDLDRVDSVETR